MARLKESETENEMEEFRYWYQKDREADGEGRNDFVAPIADSQHHTGSPLAAMTSVGLQADLDASSVFGGPYFPWQQLYYCYGAQKGRKKRSKGPSNRLMPVGCRPIFLRLIDSSRATWTTASSSKDTPSRSFLLYSAPFQRRRFYKSQEEGEKEGEKKEENVKNSLGNSEFIRRILSWQTKKINDTIKNKERQTRSPALRA